VEKSIEHGIDIKERGGLSFPKKCHTFSHLIRHGFLELYISESHGLGYLSNYFYGRFIRNSHRKVYTAGNLGLKSDCGVQICQYDIGPSSQEN